MNAALQPRDQSARAQGRGKSANGAVTSTAGNG